MAQYKHSDDLSQSVENAVSSANLMQKLTGQIYNLFTTGGDVANPSEDNFFCWVTPGIPISPSEFEFASEGLSGVVRAKAPSSQGASSQKPQSATEDLTNQLIKKRIEEIANKKFEVTTDETKITEEERKKRQEELEAQRAKEKEIEENGPQKEPKEKEETTSSQSYDQGSSESSPVTIGDTIPSDENRVTYNNTAGTSAEGSILNSDTLELSDADLNALKAERTALLYMQAENFAQMVNFIPDVSGRSEDGVCHGLSVLENEGSLYDVYDYTLKMSQVMAQELDEKTKAKIEKFRGLLETTKEKVNIITDEVETVVEPSAMVNAYNEKMAAYNDAVLEYNAKRIAALAGDNAAAVHDWSLNGKIYYNKVRAAMNAWVSSGYKNEYDQIAAYIDQVMQRDMSMLKQQYRETLDRSLITGLVSGTEFPLTTVSPANFATSSGWTSFTFSQSQYNDKTTSDVHNNSIKVDQTSKSWFHKQHYSYGKTHNTQELDMNFDMSSLKISFKICQVNIVRPWFKPAFFNSKYWRFDESNPVLKGQMLSTGGAKPTGLLPAYPTAMLLVKDLVFDFGSAESAQKFMHQYDETTHEAGVGCSIGFFGIGASANVSYMDNKTHDESENHIRQNGSAIEIPGMQIIGYRCHVLDVSPDPHPSIKNWI